LPILFVMCLSVKRTLRFLNLIYLQLASPTTHDTEDCVRPYTHWWNTKIFQPYNQCTVLNRALIASVIFVGTNSSLYTRYRPNRTSPPIQTEPSGSCLRSVRYEVVHTCRSRCRRVTTISRSKINWLDLTRVTYVRESVDDRDSWCRPPISFLLCGIILSTFDWLIDCLIDSLYKSKYLQQWAPIWVHSQIIDAAHTSMWPMLVIYFFATWWSPWQHKTPAPSVSSSTIRAHNFTILSRSSAAFAITSQHRTQ